MQEPISQDLAQDSQQGLPLSEATEITGTEDAPDQASLAEAVETLESEEAPKTEEVVEPEEVKEEPVEISFNSLDEVNLESLPDNVRSYVEPILSIASNEVSALRAEKEAFEQSRKEFSELIDAMESSGYDVKPLQNRIEEQNEFIGSMSEDMINTAWQAFNHIHPAFDSIPDNARELFAVELERLFERHEGDTVLDRMNNAYDYALWKSGVDKNSIGKPKQETPVSEQPVKSNPNARKGSVIADGRIATSAPVRSVDELDWEDVLSRHAHLLDR